MTAGTETVVPAHGDPRFATGMTATERINVRGLEQHLRRHVTGEVRFDAGSLAMYANDSSNYRQVPIGVVLPRTLGDVVQTMKACSAYRAPVTCRGGGTSLSGETVNRAVVVDFSKYLTGIGAIDPVARRVTCQTGVINEQLNEATGRHGLVFGPDPSSHSRCTIGGNIGNNSCGIHSVQSRHYGPGPRTSDNTHALEVLTYDGERFWVGVGEEDRLDEIVAAGGRKGEIYAKLRDLRDRYADDIRAGFPSVEDLPRRVSGFNLDELLPEKGFNVARALVGTESTCAVALQATLLLTPAMFERTTVLVHYPDVVEAARHIEDIQAWKPIGLETVDHQLVHDQQLKSLNVQGLQQLPRFGQGGAWLMVQFGADTAEESEARCQDFVHWLREDQGYAEDRVTVARSAQEGGGSEQLWAIRESGLGSTAFPPDDRDHWPGWEDSAVPPGRAADYIGDLLALYDRYGTRGQIYGHLGEGCIHSRIGFDLRTADGLRTYRAFLEEAADLVVSYGGTLSGEHGDGQQRAELLEKMYGPRLMQAMREFKLIWDPDWKMNPGKVVEPYRLDENLKLGTDYNPWRPEVRFAYARDGGDFAHATLRCVGVGKCRDPEPAQTMCPSYQVTREEKHTTRGRARLLFEMLRGEVITDGWQSREVAEALDLCLACKGCTNDCPVDVDMPTYKAEFRHHHYKSLRRWRGRHAYALGLIDQASRLASRVPELADLVTQTPGLRRLAQVAAGLDRRRPLPRFAPLTLQRWFAERGGTANPHGPRVVLWPDTFTNRLRTDVGVACVEALESAGWQVVMPQGHVCCGRPLYDYGFLDLAERYLHRTLDVLREEVRAGTPVVGMEPSCLAVFTDELVNLLPHDDDARRLAGNAHHFADFLDGHDVDLPRLEGTALMWGHCHHRATGGMDPEQRVLERMGLTVEPVSGGCCGLAGSWGFEKGKYDISLDCGEQALLPAVRAADGRTAVVADGFSCTTQISDAGTGRAALHVAQLIRLAQVHGRTALADARPEDRVVDQRPRPGGAVRSVRTGLPLMGLAGLAGAVAAGVRRRH
ncbi:FAD-binding and (Fe-S)-binding domain-containing protein [Blastococcus tunisiensis]|uniref:FAD/FMN-containing dehydrogenase n=1 Tax=Blastococcus tunisiensis TaxID=1798228 RepID=A0A1I2DSQ6_9ACTN|nr:FAD-binding and (Fe-S)-binding domain-containing protein [Blastococcus sp. DSM 46838]SFE83546.1 FAD/FMN-containing dehydrogenase [Blastococcus sp. DSM 46838]